MKGSERKAALEMKWIGAFLAILALAVAEPTTHFREQFEDGKGLAFSCRASDRYRFLFSVHLISLQSLYARTPCVSV